MSNAPVMGRKCLPLVLLLSVCLAWFSGCNSGGGGDGDSSTLGTDGILDPLTISKFVEPLVIPPAMPYFNRTGEYTEYHIAVRQFEQQVLPSGYPLTTVWGYGVDGDPLPGEVESGSSFNYPAFTIEARKDQKIRVKWINGLMDGEGNYLPHLLPVDRTLFWANPGGPCDSESTFASTDEITPYRGPVPIVSHLHGGHTPAESDGFPMAWYLPNAINIPSGYCRQGTYYDSVASTDAGAAVFEYPNDQKAATLWYHDHAMGLTRLNVYAGLAGFYIIRDDEEDALGLPGPAPELGDPSGSKYYEVPVVIQDRIFNTDGSLFYPYDRAYFDGYTGPFIPETDVPPVWNPEVLGNAIVVNGRTWPYMEVEPRLYRLRLLNGSNARTLILKFDDDGLGFTQIGSDGGLLPDSPVSLSQLTLMPAERADVIVDFSGLSEGAEVVLLNLGPDEPFKGPNPPEPQAPADPETTGLVMKFKVIALTGTATGRIPSSLPAISPLNTALPPRDVTLNEIVNAAADIPIEAELGTGTDGPLDFMAETTENPNLGDTEIWRIINLTEDAHPIHLHLVQFRVLDRRAFDAEGYGAAQEAYLAGGGPAPDVEDFYTGAATGPDSWETGGKDTVAANPGEVTRIIATFDRAGLYVWHCHILEHEDNEMMRPYEVVGETPAAWPPAGL